MKNKSARMPIVSAVMCGLATILGIIILFGVTLPTWASIVVLIMLGCNLVCFVTCAISYDIIKNLVAYVDINKKYYWIHK